MSELRVGVIGCGGRLRDLLGKLRHQHPDVKIVALCDPSDQAIDATRQRVGDQAERAEDVASLVGRDDIELVMIGSPNNDHREHAVAALGAGKHVYCEKPLATTLEDCLAIRDAARQGPARRFVVGFTLRFSPHYRAIRKRIDDGAIGDLISFEFNENIDWQHGGFIHQDWRRHRAMAGTHLLEKCSHDLDLANWFVGARAKRVASFGGLRFFTADNAHHQQRIGPHPQTGQTAFAAWPGADRSPFNDDKDIIDHQVAIIEYANGVRATFHANCIAGIPERRMYLLGSEGAIRADVISGSIEYQRIGWDTQIERVEANVSGGHGGGDPVLIDELYAVVRGEGEPAATLEAGLESAVTAFAIDEAMDRGCVVDLGESWRRVDQAG